MTRWMRWSAPLLMAAIWLCGGAPALAAEPAPKLLDLGVPEISAYGTVPNPDGLAKAVEGLVAMFSPQPMQPGWAKASLGAAAKDPNLAGIDAGRPMAVFVLKDDIANPIAKGAPPVVLLIPVKTPAPYQALFKNAKTVVEDNVLVVGDNEALVEKGRALVPLLKKIGDAGITGDARIYANVGFLMTSYGPILDAMIGMAADKVAKMPPTPGLPPAFMKLAGPLMRSTKDLVEQLEAIQLDAKITPDAVYVDTTYAGRKGTPLADFLTGHPVVTADNALSIVGKTGVMTGVYALNPAAHAKAFQLALDALKADPQLGEMLKGEMGALAVDAMGQVGNGGAFSMISTPKNPVGMLQAFQVVDEQKYAAIMERMSTGMTPDGALGKFYATLGMTVNTKFEKDIRKSGGVAVNRMTTKIDQPGMPDFGGPKLNEQVVEFALTKGYYLAASDAEGLDELVERAVGAKPKAPVTTKAQATFGEGLQSYVDYDVFALLSAMMAMQPGNPAAMIFANFPPSEPWQFGVGMNEGRMLTRLKVPLAPIAGIAKRIQDPPKPPPPEQDEKKPQTF